MNHRAWYWMGLMMAFFLGADLFQHKFGHALVDGIFLVASICFTDEAGEKP